MRPNGQMPWASQRMLPVANMPCQRCPKKRTGVGMEAELTRPTTGVLATADFTHALVRGDEECDLLPGEHLRRRCVRRCEARECLWVLAAHGSAVASHDAGALPKQILGLGSGERVDSPQPTTGLRKRKVGVEAKSGIERRKRGGGYDIAYGEEDVHWERE